MSDPKDIVNRMALEDRDQTYMLEVVAPLVGKLEEGKNFVNAQQFADLVRWFEDELEDPDETMETGRFEILDSIQVIRVKPPGEMTLGDIVRKTGLPKSSVARLLSQSGLPHEQRGNKKYYNIRDLAPFLANRPNRREE